MRTILSKLGGGARVAPTNQIDELFTRDGVDFVGRCYRLFLRREADEGGLHHHADLLKTGVEKLDIAMAIAGSPEARKMPDSAQMFVRLMHHVIDSTSSGRLRQAKALELLKSSTENFLATDHGAGLAGAPSSQNRPTPMLEIGDVTSDPTESSSPRKPCIWFDLTTSMQWRGGVVGIIRAELQLAVELRKLHPEIRYVTQFHTGFAEIEQRELRWLFEADNVVDAYMRSFGRQAGASPQTLRVKGGHGNQLFHPFRDRDVFISSGWKDSPKEFLLTQIKRAGVQLYIAYCVYDLILVHEKTRHFYDKDAADSFRKYLRWITQTCDLVFFGGENTKGDAEDFQRWRNWPVIPGQAVRWGATEPAGVKAASDAESLKGLGVEQPFILTVGTIEPRKNHATLYRAYVFALECVSEDMPLLVICGSTSGRVGNLIETIERDPRVKGKILILRPTDAELEALYRNCLFTVLPSVYEGWSLTLPESLEYGKFCLACDTPPLREVGGELSDYVEPYDVRGWAEQMHRYASDPALLAEKEELIRATWRPTHWSDTAHVILRSVQAAAAENPPTEVRAIVNERLVEEEAPTIWMDLTLSFLHWADRVTGITRVELMYAYYLKKLYPTTRFFAYDRGYIFEIEPGRLDWLLDAEDLTRAYENFRDFWRDSEAQGRSFRNPFRNADGPQPGHHAYIEAFPDNSVIFMVGIDYGEYRSDGTPKLHRNAEIFNYIRPDRNVTTSQFVHDLTPFMFPQVHKPETVAGYEPFIEFISEKFDHLVYGRKTAQDDGVRVQEARGWRQPPSDWVDFGTDLSLNYSPSAWASQDKAKWLGPSAQDVETTLRRLGVTGRFMLIVGTIEPRKNHETLYKAYLDILEHQRLDQPLQMIFAGIVGWRSEDLYATIQSDPRVRGKILLLNPSDPDLQVLYRQCEFTLLPSFYEGGSLTLSEGLSFGKFAIVSDVAPLREIGETLLEYVHPMDVRAWAEKIAYYANHAEDVAAKEEQIKAEWRPRTWEESTRVLWTALCRAHYAKLNNPASSSVSSTRQDQQVDAA